VLARLVLAEPLRQTGMKSWLTRTVSSPIVTSTAEPEAQLYERVGLWLGPTAPTAEPPLTAGNILKVMAMVV
jgi:hypothetical protein